MKEREFQRFQRLTADRARIDEAAARLRKDATADGHAGFGNRERAYSVAALMSTIGLHLDDVPDAVRHDALRAASELVGQREERSRASRRTRLT